MYSYVYILMSVSVSVSVSVTVSVSVSVSMHVRVCVCVCGAALQVGLEAALLPIRQCVIDRGQQGRHKRLTRTCYDKML